MPERRPDLTEGGRTPPPLPPTAAHVSGAESRSSGGMGCFRNVLLVASSDDEPVSRWKFERALGLAKRNKAKLTLFDVVHELEFFREVLPPGRLATVRRQRRLPLIRLAEAAREQGVETEAELVTGKPFQEIIRRVQRCEHDLVITTGGRSLGAGVMDSTTRHLMRECPCAIWVVRPHAGDRHRHVLAAIDPDPNHPGKDSLNRRIMEVAISMARLEGSVLHVVHVWELAGVPPGSHPEVWQRWEVTARSEIKGRLSEFLAEYELGPDPRLHLLAGRPASVISELVKAEQIDLLVMGTRCRTGVRGFFIGNTAEGVLERADCSLLTVKPDGLSRRSGRLASPESEMTPNDQETR